MHTRLISWNRSLYLPFFCFFFLCSFVIGGVSAQAEPTVSLSEEAAFEGLFASKPWDKPVWKKLLFWNKSWFGQRSMVDDPKFFFAGMGASPEAELRAFVAAVRAEAKKFAKSDQAVIESKADASVGCLWPARYEFVRSQLETAERVVTRSSEEIKFTTEQIWPKKKCPGFENFVQKTDPVGMTLVYSSFYPNSPSSLFGHTLVRMDGKRSQNSVDTASLLDVSFTFSAFPTSTNPLVYTISGLAGGFPGFFEIVPFYVKVQEYNHFESRDLWEYQVKSDSEGLKRVLGFMWEMRDKRIDYYYFDDNCALVILHLLEVVNPDLDLKSLFPSWVIPGDTVRAAYQVPGVFEGYRFRPSIFRRFLERSQQLSNPERSALSKLSELLKSEELPEETLEASFEEALSSLTEKKQKAVTLDALVDLVDFKVRRAGSAESDAQDVSARVRKKALVKRAQLGSVVDLKVDSAIPENAAPHLAHPPSRIGLGLYGSASHTGLELSFKPALHTLGSRADGFSKELEIGFMETRWRLQSPTQVQDPLRSPKGKLQQLMLFEILALNPRVDYINRNAWFLKLGFDQKEFRSSKTLDNSKGDFFGAFGYGLGMSAGDGVLHSALFGSIETGLSPSQGLYATPGARWIQILSLPAQISLRTEANAGYRVQRKAQSVVWDAKGLLVFAPNTTWELQIFAGILKRGWEFGLSQHIYF